MAKQVHVFMHGSSHFGNHHHDIQDRLREEWYKVEQTSQRQRFAAIHFDAVPGGKLGQPFSRQLKQQMNRCYDEGLAQVHIVCLGDNDLREAIDRDKVEGAYSAMQEIGHRVKALAEHANGIRDCYLVFLTPLPCPKYHRFSDMWERAAHSMKAKVAESRSATCIVRNITKCFWQTTTNARGSLTGWKIHAGLFSRDGVHLSVDGVKLIIAEIILALKIVPRFGFEREDLREIINRRR